MGRIIEKAALIKTEKTPLFEAASKVIDKPKNKICEEIWGRKSLQTVNSWLKKASSPRDDIYASQQVINDLCRNYNNFIDEHGNKLAIRDSRDFKTWKPIATEQLTPEDFDQHTKRFDFAKKIGCVMEKWESTQEAIDEVFLHHNIICRENKSDEGQAREICARFTGASIVYFRSLSANEQKPILLRSTLRIKNRITLNNAVLYVPCKLYVPAPTKYRSEQIIQYQGKVCLRNKNLYFSFTNTDPSLGDSVSMIIDSRNQWQGGFYDGIYSSTSTSHQLYSSAVVLQRKIELMNMIHPSNMRNFIDTNTKVLINDTEDIVEEAWPHNEEYKAKSDTAENIKEHIAKKLKNSPFAPFL